MEIIQKILDIVLPESFDLYSYGLHLLVAIVSIFIVVGIIRLSFGKGSNMNTSIASAIAILTIYVINVLAYSLWDKLQILFVPLPYVTVTKDYLTIFPIFEASVSEVCREFVNMTILAYVMNLMETWLPKGDKVGSWFSFRFFALIIALCLHYCLTLLLNTVLDEHVLDVIPLYLLGIVALAFLLACLKMIIGGDGAFVKNFLGAFHTFFFSNEMGKQLMRALTTSILLSIMVCVLNYLAYTAVAIAAVSFFAYFPIILVGLIYWYVISKYM